MTFARLPTDMLNVWRQALKGERNTKYKGRGRQSASLHQHRVRLRSGGRREETQSKRVWKPGRGDQEMCRNVIKNQFSLEEAACSYILSPAGGRLYSFRCFLTFPPKANGLFVSKKQNGELIKTSHRRSSRPAGSPCKTLIRARTFLSSRLVSSLGDGG